MKPDLIHRAFLPGVALAVALAGCASAPAYQAPDAAALGVPARWSSGPATAGEDLSLWWRGFGDARLTELVETAVRANPDIRTAEVRVRQARAERALARAGLAPIVSAGASAQASRTGAVKADLYQAGLDATWEADIFGGQRSAIRAAEAGLESQAAQLQAVRVSLAAETALNYVQLRAGQARLAIAARNLASQAETLQLTQWKLQAGLATELDADQARTLVEQTRAQIAVVQTATAAAEHRLGVLTGRAPGALHDDLSAPGPIPAPPQAIGAGIPADTLRQRPDVRAAERTLAAETARIGVARAALYPSLGLSGSLGLQGTSPGALVSGPAVAGSLVAQLAATIFDGGRLRQQLNIQTAVQEQAFAAYQAAVLGALEDVENALVEVARDRERCAALVEAVRSASAAAGLARNLYAAGAADFQTVLETERTRLGAEDGLAVAQADQASAVVRLYKALGGGWSAADFPAPPLQESRR